MKEEVYIYIYIYIYLEQPKSVPIHVRNLQLLMTEMCGTRCSLNPPIMKDIFLQRNLSYSLRHGDDTQLPKVQTTSFGVESIPYLGKTVAAFTIRNKTMKRPFYFQKQIRC